MRLFRQLFSGQFVQDHHLLGQYLGVQEALGKQHNQTDQLHVRDHADNRPEERFHRLRQFGTPGVSGIHRDEYPDLVVQPRVSAPKLKMTIATFYIIGVLQQTMYATL